MLLCIIVNQKYGIKIIKNGFYENSLFTCEHIRQSIQVGERLSSKYIILLCNFNVITILYVKMIFYN